MDIDEYSDLESKVYKNALLNAVKHSGEVNPNAIIGPVIEDNPSLRERAGEVANVAQEVSEDVNRLSKEDQEDILEDLAPERLNEITSDSEDKRVLPELPDVEEYDQIRMRCAPNPNGPWHLGHARMPAVIGTFKERYDGWFCVRFDDTDPATKRPSLDAYDKIIQDIEYLGFDPDAVFRASNRLDLYYKYARELIDMGKAYTCDLSTDKFSEMKKDGEPSPNRSKDPSEVLKEFNSMVEGNYSEGDMVLRIKTDMGHKNPAIRDWVAFRIIERPHPRDDAEEYRCWPMLDFQSAIDDHDINITHIIRGIDLQSSVGKQEFIYDYFGWEYPEVLHWGHVDLDGYDVPLSTSSINEMIENGKLSSWADPRAPTIESLKRRGIKGEAITNAMTELGISSTNVQLSLDTLYAKNSEIVDDSANRYFFVKDPIEISLSDNPDVGRPPRHPEFEDRGKRDIKVGSTVKIESSDVPELGNKVWLKGYGPIIREGEREFRYTDEGIDLVRNGGVPVIHWVGQDHVDTTVRKRNEEISGVAESNLTEEDEGKVVQFERFGFVRLESKGDMVYTYFAHE